MSDPTIDNFSAPPPPAPPAVEPKGSRPRNVMLAGIVIFALGLITLIAGVARILPGGIMTGIVFVLWGLALFGLSFIRLPVADPAEPPMSGIQKILGIFYQPTRVFRNLRSHPYWVAAFLAIGILSLVYQVAFIQRLTPERIVNHTMEKLEQSPIKPPPEQMEATKENMVQEATRPVHRVQTAAKSFVGVFFMVCFAGALSFLGILAFGGKMNFWQALAATFYSWLPVTAVTKLLSLLLLFIKDASDVHPVLGAETLVQDNLGVLFSPAEQPALFVLASAIGVLSFYGLWIKAKGLANAGYKVTTSAAWSVSIILWVLMLIVGAIFATIFSSFIS